MQSEIILALVLRGFIALSAQSLLLREFLITFYGNELTIGLIWANWIFWEALGSALAVKFALKTRLASFFYALIQILICLYLPVSIFLIRIIKNILAIPLGEGVGIPAVFISSFFILGPLNILDGMEFPLGCRIWADFSRKNEEPSGKVYALEALGFILAGPIFTYLFISRFHSFQIALTLAALNLSKISLLLCLSLLFSGLATKLQKTSLAKQWKNQRLISYRNSVYSNLTLINDCEQFTIFSNGTPIITTPVPDISRIEELVHFGMSACSQPAKEVLLLGAGPGGLLKEILKYKIDRVDYTEIDPALIEMVRQIPTALTREELIDPRVKIIFLDGRRFLSTTRNRYGLIIINLPLPTSLQLNRFYTQEFFALAKSHLEKNGILIFGLNGSLNYVSKELRSLNGSLLNTLKDEFPNLFIIPGDTNLYLASNEYFEITPRIITNRLRERNISTRLFSPDYIEYRLNPDRQRWFVESMGKLTHIRKNTDLQPSEVFYSLDYWNAMFSPRWRLFYRTIDKLDFKTLAGFVVIAGMVWFLLQTANPKLKRFSPKFALFTTGFSGMSLNLIFIFAYQAFYGFIFYHIALLTAAFMSGLSLASWLVTNRLKEIKRPAFFFSIIELFMLTFCLALGPLLTAINTVRQINLPFTFFILSFVVGLLAGAEFPLANKIRSGKDTQGTAGTLYAWDLMGGWLACLVISTALIPVLGILKTCIILACLKLFSLSLIISYGAQRANARGI